MELDDLSHIKCDRMERIKDCLLIQGDCLDILPQLPEGCVDAVVTDPPYGVSLDYSGDLDDGVLASFDRIVSMVDYSERVAGIVLTTVGCFAIETLLYQNRPPRWRICWRKGITSRPSPIGFTDWEPVFVYGLGSVHRHSHDLYTAKTEKMGSFGHPCPKSVDWAVWLVNRFADKDGIVLDPFMGSGTTGVACIKTGRKFIGIEKEPKYFDISVHRIANYLGKDLPEKTRPAGVFF